MEIFLFAISSSHFPAVQLDALALEIHMIDRKDVIQFVLELNPVACGGNRSGLPAPADGEVNGGIVHHHPGIGHFLTALGTDGRVAGVVRLPLVFPITDQKQAAAIPSL